MKWFLYGVCCILDNRLGNKLFCRLFYLCSIHFIYNMLLCFGYIRNPLWLKFMIWFHNRFLTTWFYFIFFTLLFNKLSCMMLRFHYSLFSSNTYFICSLYLWIGFNRSIFFSIRLFIMNCLLFNKMPNISFCILSFNGLHFLLGFYISQIYQLLCM